MSRLEEFLELKYKDFLDTHSPSNAHKLLLNYYNDQEDIKNSVSIDRFNELFSAPEDYARDSIIEEVNEHGDSLKGEPYGILEEGEKGTLLRNITNFGWLKDKKIRKDIIESPLLGHTRRSMGEIPLKVKSQIIENALHTLGRCNNPSDWGDEQDNKRGLVLGMVQSGKTANIVTLMAAAHHVGYRLFIVFTGDKNSLRRQTQLRINEAFDIDTIQKRSTNYNIDSVTDAELDYNDMVKNYPNQTESIWRVLSSKYNKDRSLVLCVKKTPNVIDKIIDDIKYIENQYKQSPRISNQFEGFAKSFKCMIIDDEADYASADTKPMKGGSATFNKLVELRNCIAKNSYVQYTATPQACLSSNKNHIVGYPKDFIWLIEPDYDDNYDTTSYMGLEEFFLHYKTKLITIISEKTWPYYDIKEGKKKKIYDPESGEISDHTLKELESETAKRIIKKIDKNDLTDLDDYVLAAIDFLIGCGFRWYRYFNRKQIKIDDKLDFPSIDDVKNDYPYHAMMFNMAYVKDNQRLILEVVESLFKKVIKPNWNKILKNGWKSDDSFFAKGYTRQLEKSTNFNSNVIPSKEDLTHFIDIALRISMENIPDEPTFVYKLNSDDEGQTLRYEADSIKDKPKKATIMVGGNILSRGLTIRNLSVSFFVRSQITSLGDTNLQMGRWFGHKRKDIDLLSIYTQRLNVDLFSEIAFCDGMLRQKFRKILIDDIPMDEAIIEILTSKAFRATSPAKSKYLRKSVDFIPFSGKLKSIMNPMDNPKFTHNNAILNNFISTETYRDKKYMLKRGWVYYECETDSVLDLLRNLKFDNNSTPSPSGYRDYLNKWMENKEYLPKINIAVIGVNENGEDEPRERARVIGPSSEEPKTSKIIKMNALLKLSRLTGGQDSKQRYLGDYFLDKPWNFHENNKTRKSREFDDGILIIFYKLNPNYIYKISEKNKIYFTKGDNDFIKMKDPLISMAFATPIGGYAYKSEVNASII